MIYLIFEITELTGIGTLDWMNNVSSNSFFKKSTNLYCLVLSLFYRVPKHQAKRSLLSSLANQQTSLFYNTDTVVVHSLTQSSYIIKMYKNLLLLPKKEENCFILQNRRVRANKADILYN